MTVEIIPVTGIAEIASHDDLGVLVGDAAAAAGLRDGDILVITQKVVSKAEGRIVPAVDEHERRAWVERESARVVAQREGLTIAETRHGFVCANAGVDASNVPEGTVSLLPEDPDRSAADLRERIGERTGRLIGVIISDTFGRPWRSGVVEVAIGVAGLTPLVDLRGTPDATGRVLESTIVAVADEIAAAAGLAAGKAAGIPAVIVRGLPSGPTEGSGRDLLRPQEEDLFRTAPLESIGARRTVRAFTDEPVPRPIIEAAVRAACTAPAPHHTRPWLFVVLDSRGARATLLSAMAEAWRKDLRADGTPVESIERRIARSDALLGAAPALVVPLVQTDGAHAYPDAERREAERTMFLLSGGAAIQNFLLAIHAQAWGGAWVSSTLFCADETRAVLGLDDRWIPLGAIAVGRPRSGVEPPPRPPLDLTRILDDR